MFAGGRADNSDTVRLDSVLSVDRGAHGGPLGAVRAADAHCAALSVLRAARCARGLRHRDPPARLLTQPCQVAFRSTPLSAYITFPPTNSFIAHKLAVSLPVSLTPLSCFILSFTRQAWLATDQHAVLPVYISMIVVQAICEHLQSQTFGADCTGLVWGCWLLEVRLPQGCCCVLIVAVLVAGRASMAGTRSA